MKNEIKIKGCPFVARKDNDFRSIFYEPENEPPYAHPLVVQMRGNRVDVLARIRILAHQRKIDEELRVLELDPSKSHE